MPRSPHDVTALEVDDDQLVARGFLAIRRVRLRNRRADGSLSPAYSCDFVVRPYGLDAVVVAVYYRGAGDQPVRVLVRECLRPALALGRAGEPIPIPDARPYLLVTELVAGIVEVDDRGMDGIRARAAAEVFEEAGYQVSPDAVTLLGQGTFPSPGTLAEKYWLMAVEISDPDAQLPLAGDGSPMEEGASTRWIDLDHAIAACLAGDIEDAKTELTLRRLRDWLAQSR